MDFYFYNLHLPKEMRVFHVPANSVLRKDEVAFVYDLRVSNTRLLRHYSFPNRWFEVNTLLDLEGNFVDEEAGGLKFCFNCDISTPHFYSGEKIVNKDLWLDVLITSDGRTYQITGEDDFAEVQANGWLTDSEITGACQGLDELLEIIHTGGLINFLEAICSFQTVITSERPLPVKRFPPAQFSTLIG